MTKTRTGIMLATAAIAGACSGGAVDTIGDAMVDAGRMLTDAGTSMRDAMGGGDAQAMDSGGQGTDGSSPGDSGNGDAAEDSGTPASRVYTASCDHETVFTQTSQSDPDITYTNADWWARIDIPTFDAADPPQVTVWTCNPETGLGFTDAFAQSQCGSGYDCTDTGERPTTGCAEGGVSRMVGRTAWVRCGYRQRHTNADGEETHYHAQRWNTVRLVVD